MWWIQLVAKDLWDVTVRRYEWIIGGPLFERNHNADPYLSKPRRPPDPRRQIVKFLCVLNALIALDIYVEDVCADTGAAL